MELSPCDIIPSLVPSCALAVSLWFAASEALSFEKLFRWQSLSLVGKGFRLLSIDLIVLLQWESETLYMFICLDAKSSLLFPAFRRCHILKESKIGKEQIYSQSWKTMNYLSFESFHYLCMKGSPLIKSKCFFLCMSIRVRPELIDFCGIFS